MSIRRQDNPFPLCHFQFADGRQCAMPASHGSFCRSHAQPARRRPAAEDDLSAELNPLFTGADSSLDVHRALERVFQALSSNRISPRRAAAFGYLGQLILLSKPGEESQSLCKRDLNNLANVTLALLKAAYGPDSRRASDEAQATPPAAASRNYDPRRR